MINEESKMTGKSTSDITRPISLTSLRYEFILDHTEGRDGKWLRFQNGLYLLT